MGCTSAEEPTPAPIPASDAKVDSVTIDSGAKDTAVAPMDTSTEPTDTGEVHADTAIEDTDTAAESGPPPVAVDCLSGSFGPSSYTLVDFFYQLQVGSCTSSFCSDFVTFDPSCTMSLQVADVKTTATLDPSDCTLFKKWLTSDLLVNHLRDTVTCYYGKDGPSGGGVYESSELDLADGAANKKTWMCPNEPFKSHRNCINALRAKYFPGK